MTISISLQNVSEAVAKEFGSFRTIDFQDKNGARVSIFVPFEDGGATQQIVDLFNTHLAPPPPPPAPEADEDDPDFDDPF